MKTSVPRIRQEAVWVMFTVLAMGVLYAVGFRFISDHYSPEVFGEYTLLSGVLTIAAGLALNPIFAIDVRFYPDYRERGLSRWFRGQIHLLLRKSLVILALFCLVGSFIWSVLDGWNRMLIGGILFLILLSQALSAQDMNTHSISRRQGRLSLIRIVRVSSYPLAAVALSLSFGSSLSLLLIASAAGFIVPWILSRALGWQKQDDDKCQPTTEELPNLKRAMSLYGLPFVLIAIGNWISVVGDRYIMVLNISLAEIGIYSAIYGLFCQPYLMLAGGLSQWLRPILFDAVAQGNIGQAHKLMKRWLVYGTICSVAGGIIMYLGQDILFSVLLSKKYHYSGSLIVFLLIANTMHVVSSALSHQLMAAKQTTTQIGPLVIAALTNVCCNLVFVPSMGIDGAGLATAVSFTVYSALMGWVVWRLPLPAAPSA